MNNSSQLALETFLEPPEMDDSGSEEKLEKRIENAISNSSAIDILQSINKDFKYLWLVLQDDIKNMSNKEQIVFSEKVLEKIYEEYDYSFPEKIDLISIYSVDDVYKFIEFLEYDNINFLVSVWKFLDTRNLMKLDINEYCKENSNKVIKEIEEQSDSYFESKLISIFLRTYYKDKMIEWFINHSKRLKVEITVHLN